MYRCNSCKAVSDKINTRVFRDGSTEDICPICGGRDVSRETGHSCHVCGEALYSGDAAFEAGDMLFCPACVTRVLI